MRSSASYTSRRADGLPGRRSWMPVLVSSRRRVVGLMPRSPHSFAIGSPAHIPTCCRCEKLIGELAHRCSTRDISALEVSQCCVPVDPEGRCKSANVDAGGVQVDQVVDFGAGQSPLPLEVGRSATRANSPGAYPWQDLHGPGEVVRGVRKPSLMVHRFRTAVSGITKSAQIRWRSRDRGEPVRAVTQPGLSVARAGR